MGTVLVLATNRRTVSPERRCYFDKELTIGRVEGNDLQLPTDNVARRHARVIYRDGRVIVLDLKSASGTYVNRAQIRAPTIVREGDVVQIGDWDLRFEEPLEIVVADPRERAFLDTIEKCPSDQATRQVYGDWLEEHGRTVEAAFLSMKRERSRSERSDREDRRLAAKVPRAWRILLAQPAIEGCENRGGVRGVHGVREVRECPKTWDALVVTDDLRVRACDVCHQKVYFAPSMTEARRRRQNGQCVALDLTIERSPGDLDEDDPILVTVDALPPEDA